MAIPPPVRVLVVDDDTRSRTALRALLETCPGIHVVGEAGNGAAAVEVVLATRPDVVVLDGIMPRLDGIAATRRIKRLAPDVAILVLTLYGALEWDSKQAGADAFLLKSADAEEIVETTMKLGRRTRRHRGTCRKTTGKDRPT